MRSYNNSSTDQPRSCNQSDFNAGLACLYSAAAESKTTAKAIPVHTVAVTVTMATSSTSDTATKQIGSVLAFGDGPGAARPSTIPLQEPGLTAPVEPAPTPIPNVSADPNPPQAAPTAPDAQTVPIEATVTVRPVHGHDHTVRLNGTKHKSWHYYNQTKTVTNEITKTMLIEQIANTKLATEASESFPQLRTYNSSRPIILPESTVLTAHYDQFTTHIADVANPSQTASFGTFHPAIPGIPQASTISSHPAQSQGSSLCPSTSMVFGISALVILFVAAIPLVHHALMGVPEEEEAQADPETLAELIAWERQEQRRDEKRQLLQQRRREKAARQHCAEDASEPVD